MGRGKKRRGPFTQSEWHVDIPSGSRQEEDPWEAKDVSDWALLSQPQSRVIQTPEALKNQDILNLIFQHFDVQPGSRTVAESRKTLFSAAKTCKAFVEPALDLLWRVLPSLLPLLLLLPSAEVSNGQYFVDEVPLVDDANESSGWRRLDVHARRVRTLCMEPLHIAISPIIYFRIRDKRDSPLLPGLKKIYIPNNPPLDLYSALFLASGSTLDVVQIDGNATSDRQFIVPFLSSLYTKSPSLSHLALREVVLSSSVEPIYRFTELQSLEIRLLKSHLPPELLHKLGQLPHLLDLIIDTGVATTSIQPHTSPISISNSQFRQLRHLQIIGTTASISYLLDELKGLTNLSSLKIDQNSRNNSLFRDESSWGSFFDVISTFSAVADIEIFNRPPETISVSSFAPLYKLDNLKSFVMNDSVKLLCSDDDFRLLAEGFRNLKKFVIHLSPFSGEKTLACLYHLSRECPELREIRIALSSNISDNLNAIKKLPHPIARNHQHPLEKLYIDADFGQLKPIQLVQLARFLDLIFPNLSTLKEADDSKKDETENWAGIHELRLALQDARTNPVSDI